MHGQVTQNASAYVSTRRWQVLRLPYSDLHRVALLSRATIRPVFGVGDLYTFSCEMT